MSEAFYLRPNSEPEMKKIAYLLVVAFAFMSCSNDRAKIESLEQEVLELHDDVMAKMGDLAKFEEALAKQMADTTSSLDSLGKIELDSTRARVLRAHQGMLNWMRQYNPPAIEKDKEAAQAYFEEQKEKMSRLRDLTNQSIEEAKSIIKE